jgi:hypothetical protein
MNVQPRLSFALVLLACAAGPLRAASSDATQELPEAAASPAPLPPPPPADTEAAPRRIPEITGPVFHETRSTPYPGGALYLSRGISGSFMGGKNQNLGDKQSLFQWQGEVAYFYSSWLSAGAGFLITAGEPSDSAQKVHNRYFLHVRAHKAWNKVALYGGPRLGLDNLNLLRGSADSAIRRPIKDSNMGLGIDLGGGWKFSRWVGLTFGAAINYSLVGEQGSFLGNEMNIHLLPGIAVDVLAFTDGLRELVPALYLSVEYQSGFLLFERAARRNDRAGIFGISLAF